MKQNYITRHTDTKCLYQCAIEMTNEMFKRSKMFLALWRKTELSKGLIVTLENLEVKMSVKFLTQECKS